MNQDDDRVGWWVLALYLALWELPGAIVHGLVAVGLLWLWLTLFPPH
jgi:hypothetical protein